MGEKTHSWRLHGGDVVYLYNSRSQTFVLRKTLDMFERQMIQQNRAFPFMGPVQSEAETFRIEVVPDPPLAPWQPRQRAPPEPLRSPLNSNTVVHLVRNGTQYLTNIQGQGAQTFRAQYRYNLIVAHNSVLAYTTWKDNAQACYFTLSSEKEETSKEVHAFTDLKLKTFYTGVAITDPEVPGSETNIAPSIVVTSEGSISDYQWQLIPEKVVRLRGCKLVPSLGLTISPGALDQSGHPVFRSAEACNAFQYAYPKKFVIGWQCEGIEAGLSHCVSVTQYTANPKQPLFDSPGSCLLQCSGAAGSEGSPAPTKATQGSKGTPAPIEATQGSVGSPGKQQKKNKPKENVQWVTCFLIIGLFVFLGAIFFYGQWQRKL